MKINKEHYPLWFVGIVFMLLMMLFAVMIHFYPEKMEINKSGSQPPTNQHLLAGYSHDVMLTSGAGHNYQLGLGD